MNRPIILSRYGFGVFLLCMVGVSSFAQAQPGGFTAVEIAGLPQYCQDKMDGDKKKQKWIGVYGPENWRHVHHFCYGLIYFSRASMDFDARRRGQNATYGIGEFNYVLRRWPANHPFYSQAQMYKTQLEMMKN